VYALTKKQFRVYTLKFEKLFEADVEDGKRFRRENDAIMIIAKNTIFRYISDKELVKVFGDPEAQIVDKNTLAYFEIKANKLYLYTLENSKETKQQTEPEPTQKENKNPDESEEKKEQPDLIKLMEEVSEVQSLGVDNL
jgi:RPA family protein